MEIIEESRRRRSLVVTEMVDMSHHMTVPSNTLAITQVLLMIMTMGPCIGIYPSLAVENEVWAPKKNACLTTPHCSFSSCFHHDIVARILSSQHSNSRQELKI